jgi:hypothetical protein
VITILPSASRWAVAVRALRAWRWPRWRRAALAALVSLLVHGLVVNELARWLVPPVAGRVDRDTVELQAHRVDPAEQPPKLEMLELAPVPTVATLGTALLPELITAPATLPAPPQVLAPSVGLPQPSVAVTRGSDEFHVPPLAIEVPPASTPAGGSVTGATAEARAKVVLETAGSPAATAAIERGLTWLVAHQHADGGWRFNTHLAPCAGRCRNSGAEPSTTAATGLALLPLLPTEPSHGDAVGAGLAYLQDRMIVSPRGGDLQEGTMYGQGIAGLALARAYAQHRDERLRQSAQFAADFIVRAQHPRGGWRYFPGQAGDTTVVGWQLAALHAARDAGLHAPPQSFERASEFLDSVQTDDGAAYGYQRPEKQRTTTAIGLFCRIQGGHHPLDPRILRGAAQLIAWGPAEEDMYFNYYAVQVLHRCGAPDWLSFRERLVRQLISAQATSGHEAGSWHFADPHTSPGGRLCDTALVLLILQQAVGHQAD